MPFYSTGCRLLFRLDWFSKQTVVVVVNYPSVRIRPPFQSKARQGLMGLLLDRWIGKDKLLTLLPYVDFAHEGN
jgi:hypothetical protein